MVEVCEGAPVAVSGVASVSHQNSYIYTIYEALGFSGSLYLQSIQSLHVPLSSVQATLPWMPT